MEYLSLQTEEANKELYSYDNIKAIQVSSTGWRSRRDVHIKLINDLPNLQHRHKSNIYFKFRKPTHPLSAAEHVNLAG